MAKAELAKLPRVDHVALHPALDDARRRLGPEAVTALARRAIDDARREVLAGGCAPALDAVADAARKAAESALGRRTRRVINATGVVLHTNLGRAPLSAAARDTLAATAGRYASLELDLETGRRGGRAAFAEQALAQLAGAEAALVVNNCAAAVLLVLSVVAAGKAVVVSRGELVEIGGGFRVPEVMERSGARLVEVGTTNRTRLDDYARALDRTPDAAAILRVHQGNFRQVGFVERPERRALAELAHARDLPLLEDLGGGAMVDLGELGLPGEPTVRACVDGGADVVCFSTDKVLGGPQGGAVVGRRVLVDRARRDPLARALRLGRLPLVALEATLEAYLARDFDAIPILAAVRRPLTDVRARAERWAAALTERGLPAQLVDLAIEMGGGSLADRPLASAGVALTAPDVDAFAAALRAGDPAVMGRIHEGALLLDARTVLPDEDDDLLDALTRAWSRTTVIAIED